MDSDWNKLIENKIREAQEAGDFDNLKRRGAVPDQDDSHIPEDERLAAHVLKTAGAKPEWIEEDLGLRQMMGEARARISRSYAWRERQLDQASSFEERDSIERHWKKAVARLEADVHDINKAIFNFNLRAPATSVQRLPLRLNEELARLRAAKQAGQP
ncbi:MAG: DnaJ family domain-containing protein [Thermoflexales bacterium]